MLTTVKEHMEIIKGLEGLGWQEILGFSNQQLLPFTKEIDTDEKRRILKQLGKYFRPSRDGYTRFVSFLGRSCTFSSRSEKWFPTAVFDSK